MLKELLSHNNPGKSEQQELPQRATQSKTQANVLNFEFLFHEADMPVWNEETQTFELTGQAEAQNPFRDGFRLSPSDPTYHEFTEFNHLNVEPAWIDELAGDPLRTKLGYYVVPSAYLGYKPDESPSIYLHQFDAPREFLLNKASIMDNDTLTWDEAMSEAPEEVAKWLKAADVEIKALEAKQAWDEIPLKDATTKVIPGTWVFRRKRAPDGTITKYKARWVIRGDLQEVAFDTYAPVVSWTTVRIFLTLGLILGWVMKALDFDNAFIQATLKDEVFAHIPRGYKSMVEERSMGRACLKLRKSLYGLSIAPKLWYEHLKSALKEMGFVSSSYDQCLLYKPGCILITFVDDCGLAVESEELITWFVTELRNKGFELEVEGDFDAYLGVSIEKIGKDKIQMRQTGLMQKIFKASNMEDCKPNHTPASLRQLGSDPNGEPFTQNIFGYRNLIGMMLYLSTNTRPDISFAVSQAAKYSTFPKMSHATAVKTIVRYLKGTADKGIICTLTKDLKLECYVDADFAGSYGSEAMSDPNSAKSRGAYIITLGGILLTWKTKTMSAICLSTLESEYLALSIAMREVIAIKQLLEEICENFGLTELKTTIRSTIFEDNQGALSLATNQRQTSRTKYFHVKWHHFWSHVGDAPDQVKAQKVDTTLQKADYLTKPLPRETFENIRRLVQGW